MDDRQQVSAEQAAGLVVIQVDEIPQEIAELTMADPDHVDCQRLLTDQAASCPPERWARVALDDIGGAQGQFIWRAVLGLRLASRSAPGHVAGWRIAEQTPTWIRLEAAGWLIAGEILVHLDDEHLSLVTALRYRRRLAAYVWGALQGFHGRVAPSLLRETYVAIGPAA
ncbi:hypothetical protein ACFVVM_10080 [Nocardia sp. NPDC058176]|uniref:hypothetical protein n=1 Tax=Nocardia sp. NPDC058176 TaxID=3346368 RepID=UPI0036D85763